MEPVSRVPNQWGVLSIKGALAPKWRFRPCTLAACGSGWVVAAVQWFLSGTPGRRILMPRWRPRSQRALRLFYPYAVRDPDEMAPSDPS